MLQSARPETVASDVWTETVGADVWRNAVESDDTVGGEATAADTERDTGGDRDTGAVRRERLYEADGVVLLAVAVPVGARWRPTVDTASARGYVARGSVAFRWPARQTDETAATVTTDTDEFFAVPAGRPPSVVARGGPATLLVAFDTSVAPDAGDAATRSGSTRPTPAAERAAATAVAGREAWGTAGELANVTRHRPFPDAPADAVQTVRGSSTGSLVSEWHHHGDNHVFGFVLDGDGFVEWGTGEGERVFVESGECFHVPAGFVHRDRSDSPDDQAFVLWLTGSDPRTVHVDEPTIGDGTGLAER
ncbi:cupin domain-containing protein [Halobaculum sp. MBLA0147]|uniref:cupin domain-containing protein n=1 Tax=Halobaculum sp. MBLA0147 TaxID=3079934 RepID=UPI0035242820